MGRGRIQVEKQRKERAFVRALVAGPPGVRGIAWRSAQAAGYKGTEQSLATIGSRLLDRPHVVAAVEKSLEAMEETNDRLLEELGRICYSDAREIIAAQRLIAKGREHEIPDHVAAVIASVERTRYGVKVTREPKVPALALRARIRKLVIDRHEHTGPGGGPIEHAVTFYLPEPRRVIVAEMPALPAPTNGGGS